MQAELRVTPSELKATASEFDGIHNQMQSQIDQMKELVRNTSQHWEGDAANAFRAKFNSLEDDMTKMKAMIREHVQDLNDIATRYEQAESENQNDTGSLRGDVIS